MHRDYDLTQKKWLDTWHEETNATEHTAYERSLENYNEELQQYSWMAAPKDYDITKVCNLQCTEECLSMREDMPFWVVEKCNTKRCNCYYSAIKEDLC